MPYKTVKNFTMAIELLTKLVEGSLVPDEDQSSLGVCGIFEVELNMKLHYFIKEIMNGYIPGEFFKDFEYYSGSDLYPIQHPYIVGTREGYTRTPYKWGEKGREFNPEYYRRRIAFCKFLIEKFSEYLDKVKKESV